METSALESHFGSRKSLIQLFNFKVSSSAFSGYLEIKLFPSSASFSKLIKNLKFSFSFICSL